MIDHLDSLLAQSFGGTITEPKPARLGNPTLTGGDRINVPLTETDQPGMVYIHDIYGEAQGVGMALNAGPGRLTTREKVFGDYILVRKRRDGTFVVAGPAYEDHAEYMHGVVIEEPVVIKIGRFDYGLLQPTAPVSMTALVSQGFWRDANGVYFIADQFTKDFTADIPATGGQAIAVLIEITPATGALTYTNGSAFDATLTHLQAFANYPQPTGALVGWVKLTNSMTTLIEGSLLPAQLVLGYSAGAGGSDALVWMGW